MGLSDLVSRLEHRLALLGKGSRTAPARHQALAATIEWSYRLLDEDAQRTLRHLSVFAGSFSPEAVASVVGQELPAEEAFEVLSELVAKSLVVLVDTGGEARYRLLETVREYSGLLLQEHGEHKSAHDGLLAWSVGLAEQADERSWGLDASRWLDRIDLEVENIRAALRWALVSGAAELGLQLGACLRNFWLDRGYVTEGRRWLAELLGLRAPNGRRSGSAPW